jgi:hypothetical protein
MPPTVTFAFDGECLTELQKEALRERLIDHKPTALRDVADFVVSLLKYTPETAAASA